MGNNSTPLPRNGNVPILGGRRYQIVLPSEYDANLKVLCDMVGASPTEWLTNAAQWSIRVATMDLAKSIAISTFLMHVWAY